MISVPCTANLPSDRLQTRFKPEPLAKLQKLMLAVTLSSTWLTAQPM